MRARGIHNGTLFEMESDIRKKKTQGLGAILKDRKLSENTRGQKIRDMKTWLTLFCKHVGDKVPVENMTVVPYRQIKTIWEEYVDDINVSSGLYGTPAGISHFRAVWNRWSVKHNVRLLRETGSFVNCTICTAYHSRLRKVNSMEERSQIKMYRRAHFDKQRTQ